MLSATSKHFATFFLTWVLAALPHTLFSKETKPPEDLKTEIKEYISHHLQDSYSFSLFSYTNEEGKHIYKEIPLPVLLWDEGLVVFSSTKLHHGEDVVSVGKKHYKLEHGKIYKTDAEGTITYDGSHHVTNEAPLDLSITKSVTSMLLVAALMFFLFRSLARSYSLNGGLPSGIGRFFEPIVLYIRDEIARPNIGDKKYGRYMNFLLTIFFFIWFLNLLGLTPLGVNVTGNIAITFGLALITFLITNFTGTKDYWLHIFDPLGSSMKWYAKVPLYIILIPIEVLGIFIKPFSLLIRLYANMQAGHIVLMSLIGLMFIFKSWLGSPLSFGLAFAISIIELLVALLQAYIFTMLSALYFGFAAQEHEHH
jgi:F-type H+-transporting ATPase subunit a